MSPRPPAPCSLAPGLPLSRRPAPWRLWVVVALAVLLVAIPVSAATDDIVENESYTYYVGGIISSTVTDIPVSGTGNVLANRIGCRFPHTLAPSALVLAPPQKITCSNNTIFYDVRPFKCDISGVTVATGHQTVYRSPDAADQDYIVWTFDTWNWTGFETDYAGFAPTILWGNQPAYSLYVGSHAQAYTSYPDLQMWSASSGGSTIVLSGKYTFNTHHTWTNLLSAVRDGDAVTLQGIKTVDGVTSLSRIVLRSLKKVEPYVIGSLNTNNVTRIVSIDDAPFELCAYSPVNGAWYNRTAFAEYAGTPTEPTPGGLGLTLSPATATVSTPITAALTTSAETPRYSEITYGVTDPAGNVAYDTYSLDQETWTTWQHYNKTSWRYDPSSETAAHNHIFTPTSAGIWTVTATIRDRQPPATGEALASASATCEVSRAAGNVDVAISIYDGASSSTPLLYGVGVLVEDLTTNGTVLLDTREYRLDGWTGTTNGRVTVQAPLGHQIRVTAQKQGYVTRAQTDYVQPTAVPLNQMPVSIILSPATTPGPEQVYLTVLVTDLRSQPIQGATVTAAGKAGTTGAQGTCRLSVPLNQTISWTVRADGYHGASGIALPLDANSQMTVQLQPDVPATPGPGETPGGPGATPTPDHRTNEQKGQAVIDMIADNAEGIGALALICLLMGLLKLLAKW